MNPEVFAMVGWRGLLGVALLWAIVVGGFAVAARLRLLPSRLAGLFALGLSGCGVSAVVAVAGRDKSIEGTPQTVATLMILIAGGIALVTYPFIGDWLGLDAATFGTFAGLTVANNAEAIATASTREDPSLLVGAAYKVVVNTFEGLAVVLYLWLFSSRPQAKSALKLGVPKIPGYVLGFVAVGTAALLGAFTPEDRAALSGLTKWAFFVALVGVGFRTRLDQLGKAWKATLVGLIFWVGTSALVLLWLLKVEA
jgi:uncharacterized membrane protein YadS